MFQNINCEKQVILLMIPKREGCKAKSEGWWHYLAIEKQSAFLRVMTSSKYHGDFYCLNCFHSFTAKNILRSHKRLCENKHSCNIVMPSEDTKMLEFNQYKKSDKAPFIIPADLECIIEKIDGCKNNPENSSTTKASKHIPSGFSISTISSFRSIENRHGMYRGNDCMKTFCDLSRAWNENNFKKKQMKLLTKGQQELYENAKICYICKEKIESKYSKDEKIL